MSREKSDQAFRLAVQHHQAGRLGDAETAYRRAISFRPNNADAMQLLGVVLSQTGRLDEGFDLIRRAIALAPKAAGYHGQSWICPGQQWPEGRGSCRVRASGFT